MKSITNFRDLAGLQTTSGQIVKPKALLRSGELTHVSPADQQQLVETYHLKKVIDLRSREEIQERPNIAIPTTDYVHIDIIETVSDEGASLDDFIKIGSVEQSQAYMHQLYRDIALNAEAQQGYHHFFEQLAATPADQSLLFHCFAGKDRTGIAATLALEVLGVTKADIYKDYLLTNQLRQVENASLLKEAAEKGLSAANQAALNVALTVEASYLDEFYRTITEHYASIAVYLQEVIGVETALQTELRQRLLQAVK